MHDVPKALMDQIKTLEEQFTVPHDKLLEITDRFESELKKGMFPLTPSLALTTSANLFGHHGS